MNLAQFYNEYINKVYKFYYIKCLDKHTAEDLTSQTFLLFVEHVNSGKEIEDNKKYLYGIMRNVWLQFLKKKYEDAISGIENIEDFEDYSVSQTNAYESTSIINRIMPYINKLPPKQRQVIRMRHIEQKSVSEVAISLGKDKNYVKTTQHRGISRLREMLKEPFIASAKEQL